MFLRRPERAAFLVLSCGLLALVAGCGGSNSPSTPAPVTITAPTDAGAEQTFGDIRTRIVGTAQQPVVSAAPGATVIGIAGATISDITQSSANRTLITNQIVFSSIRDGNYEIYRMNSDGTSQIRLTNNTADDNFPSYSPDGSKVVFLSNRDGNYEIYRTNSDGTSPIRLTDNAAFDYFPSYSPDGNKIVFLSNRAGNFQIYSMNSDGTSPIRLTNNTGGDLYPSYSADGSKIVFSSIRDGNYEIYSMNSDGTSQIRLTNSATDDDFPSYSPDGNKIVFSSSRDGNYEIYSMNSDGTSPIRLTNSAGGDLYPSYSADGNKIVFSSIRDGNYEIYSMNTNGSGLVRLTTNSVDDFTSVKPSFGTFGYATSKLLGTDGAFGTAGGGFLLGQKGATTTSVVTFDSATVANRANLRVAAQTLADTTASNLVFTVTASDSLGSLKFYNEFATAAPTVATVVPVTLPTGTTGAVVSFDAATGKVATVLPYAANRGAGSAKSMQSGDTITYTGSFSGVWSGDGDNKAPSGASSVRLNAKTGALLGFE